MTLNQNIADLLGLDLTDPEVIAALAEQQEITTIRARVREVLTRTGTTEAALAALLGITADKTRASLAGERRFSTYELAVIATHGKTTVEWLCGEYPDYEYVEHPDAAWYRALPIEARVEFEEEFAAAVDTDRATVLAAWRSTGEVYADPELLAALTSDQDEGDDEQVRSTRWFWWHASSLTRRWRPLYWGTDENCNPTIGLRVPGGVIFLCRGWRLRQDECEECRSLR